MPSHLRSGLLWVPSVLGALHIHLILTDTETEAQLLSNLSKANHGVYGRMVELELFKQAPAVNHYTLLLITAFLLFTNIIKNPA